MIIDCISDLHGFYPKLEGGDLLIIAGDLTARDTILEHEEFFTWIGNQNYTKKIFIGGNHDNQLIEYPPYKFNCDNIEHLCNSGTEFEGLKIWGSPHSLWFHGVNPKCKAFMKKERELRKIWMDIPRDIDILITHCPPFGILDGIEIEDGSSFHAGSLSLRDLVVDGSYFSNLKLHVFGHIHEHGGKMLETTMGKFVNASIVDEYYKHVNESVRVII